MLPQILPLVCDSFGVMPDTNACMQTLVRQEMHVGESQMLQ